MLLLWWPSCLGHQQTHSIASVVLASYISPGVAERLLGLQATEQQESAKLRQAEREAAEQAAAADDNSKLLKAENVQVSP